jgi:NIMA (never in mitosis gene a)-related kinase
MCTLKPPFKANDMQGLYEKIIKGNYQPIPEHFSQELALIISLMIKVSPLKRISCADLIEN